MYMSPLHPEGPSDRSDICEGFQPTLRHFKVLESLGLNTQAEIIDIYL